ncbi:predicted protein [Chaetoceros tenuissimus]|uniref:MYND-type domain-containing protein n=1 Tax=Chaetoceros tenuissimus TaxID=426638 RepID=A0AAD3H939_9STRA|nr:predicted protein [Chaetoceros tenuissimus]
MGKSSKTKGKKLAKQERAMHLKNVEVWEKTMSTIDNQFYTSLGGLLSDGRKRRENVDKKETIAKITENALDVIHKHEDMNLSLLVFLERTMTVMIRQPIPEHCFEKAQLLSFAMLRNVCKGEFEKQWMNLARSMSVFSSIDKFRFHFSGGHEQLKIQAILEELKKMMDSSLNQLTLGIKHLAKTLLEYYTLIYEKEKHSWEPTKEKTSKCIESLEKYIALITTSAQNICYICQDDDTPDHENLVCQGCRVVSYCCKYHQRLNYIHHEATGTRGLGHKQLCPVFKSYRRKRENTDIKKQGHLERNFQRACKRFLRGTLENNSIGGIS